MRKYSAESEAFTLAQRERIRANIRARGMSLEVFLPELLADWLREKIAAGVYADAKEAVRKELLPAMIKDSLEEPG